MLMYSEETLRRFKQPTFAREMKDADAVGEVGNVRCGDVMRIYLKIKNEKIVDISFLTYGCVAAIATTDALCSLAKGKTLAEAEKLGPNEIVATLGEVPAIKFHCSVLGHEALKKAITSYRDKGRGALSKREPVSVDPRTTLTKMRRK